MEEHCAAAVADDGDGVVATPEAGDHADEDLLAEVLMLLHYESPEGLTKACDLFRAGVPERLAEIDTALAEGRFDDTARSSHSLRGSAGAFGARRLRSLGERLEQLCHESDGAAAVPLIEEMRGEFLVFRAILDGRLAELPASS